MIAHALRELLALTLKPAQYCIHQTLGPGFTKHRGCRNRRRHGSMIGNAQPLELIESDSNQGSEFGVTTIQWSAQELIRLATAVDDAQRSDP